VQAGDAAACDIVVMAVKPQDLADVLADVVPRMRDGAVLASVAAGWPTERLADAAPGHPVVRLMPNLAVAHGAGVVAMASRGLDDSGVAHVQQLLEPLGAIVVLDEALFPVATAIGGSGPGFVAYIAAAMERAAVDEGMPPAAARAMVQGVLAGTAALLSGGVDPAELQARVTSPGGTTAAGVAAMDERAAAMPTGRVTGALWRFFHESTEWYLRPFRRVIPPLGMFDLSPIVALIVLYVVNAVVVRVMEAF